MLLDSFSFTSLSLTLTLALTLYYSLRRIKKKSDGRQKKPRQTSHGQQDHGDRPLVFRLQPRSNRVSTARRINRPEEQSGKSLPADKYRLIQTSMFYSQERSFKSPYPPFTNRGQGRVISSRITDPVWPKVRSGFWAGKISRYFKPRAKRSRRKK